MTDQPSKTSKGSRKLRHIREQSCFLAGAYLATLILKADHQLFITFCTALGALSGFFIAGNVKVHQAQKAAQP